MDSNKLIELGMVAPELANAAQEFHRLISHTDDPIVGRYLRILAEGLLTVPNNESRNPFLSPVPMVNPNHRFIGNEEGVGNVDCYLKDGIPVSVWRTTDFIYRMQFLATGSMAVEYTGHKAAPLCLRLDVTELGFVIQKTE